MTPLPKWLNALSFFPCRIRSRMPCMHACSRAASDLLENFPSWKICFSCCCCTGIETCILDRQSAATQKLKGFESYWCMYFVPWSCRRELFLIW
jgi:hypothetical protein